MNDTFKDEGGKILYTNKEMLELLPGQQRHPEEVQGRRVSRIFKDRRQVLLLNVGHPGFPEEHTQRTLSIQLNDNSAGGRLFLNDY